MRQPLVLGNWKMNGSLKDNRELLQGLVEGLNVDAGVGVCPPAVYIPQAVELLQGTNIAVGSQDVSAHGAGAYTGELQSSMLKEVGCAYALVGHSERREYHGESNAQVAEKFKAAQASGLVPVLCIGETLEQREAETTLDVIAAQLKAVIDKVGESAFSSAVVAYEPVWAIGTGKTATPEQAQEVHKFIRAQLGAVGEGVQILYGGSVKADNAESLFAKPDIDGALVGGASLKVQEFIAICSAAAKG